MEKDENILMDFHQMIKTVRLEMVLSLKFRTKQWSEKFVLKLEFSHIAEMFGKVLQTRSAEEG